MASDEQARPVYSYYASRTSDASRWRWRAKGIYNGKCCCSACSRQALSLVPLIFSRSTSFVVSSRQSPAVMKLAHIPSRQPSTDTVYTLRKHTPWIASPLEKVRDDSDTDNNHLTEATESKHASLFSRVLPFHHGHLKQPRWRHHHESSTIELFYDLFFVANLATFTANHEIVDTTSLKNYVGFYCILEFTWFQTSFFDVRFATDSVFNRLCKAISFGVMTGFAITGAIYDTADVAENVKAFRALSIILMVSRLALVVQYGVVLYYVREYKQTFLPLASTMITLFLTSMAYLGTFWGYDVSDTGDSFPIQHSGPQTYIAYYVLGVVEAFSVIAISCTWRVVSFKHTHLVERIGLLTLIIMGEGIIGMSKSVSRIIQNSAGTSSGDIGVIISAVLLIYFIWVLYFDQIENDRFGTIRQQIWAILHFPFHVAVLLTVEGSTALILWNIICTTDNAWWSYSLSIESTDTNYYNFSTFESPSAVTEYLHTALEDISTYFKNGTFEEGYNSTGTFTSLASVDATFPSDDWKAEASDIIYELWVGVENFIFENFGIEIPERPSTTATTASSAANAELAKNSSLYNVFSTVFTYFPIAAGVFLVLLAVLYWFGKTRKTGGEWASVAVRAVAGCGLSMMALAAWYGDGYGFVYGPWAIPTVTLAFFFVIVVDNALVWWSNRNVVARFGDGGPVSYGGKGDATAAARQSESGGEGSMEQAREVV